MNIYFTASQIPELRGLDRPTRHLIAKKAERLMRQENPWFYFSAWWMFDMSVFALILSALLISQIYEPRLGLHTSLEVGAAAIFFPLLITTLSFYQILVCQVRPFLRKVKSESQSQTSAA